MTDSVSVGQSGARTPVHHLILKWYGNWERGEPRLWCTGCERWLFEMTLETPCRGRSET